MPRGNGQTEAICQGRKVGAIFSTHHARVVVPLRNKMGFKLKSLSRTKKRGFTQDGCMPKCT